jgi:hypothetical protein
MGKIPSGPARTGRGGTQKLLAARAELDIAQQERDELRDCDS